MPRREPQPDPELLCAARIIHQDRVDQARQAAPDARETERLAAVYRALGDPGRLGLLLALRGGEMCVCDLAAYLGASESAVSHQLRRLRDLSLVRSHRRGQCLYYFLDDHHVAQLLAVSLEHMQE